MCHNTFCNYRKDLGFGNIVVDHLVTQIGIALNQIMMEIVWDFRMKTLANGMTDQILSLHIRQSVNYFSLQSII